MASSSTSVETYDVFISFRGADTRKGFTSFLYDALRDKGIETFIDEVDLKKGGKIAPVLLGAIEASTISIIVFSENYAESRWCLDELNHVVHCMEERGQDVLPVFYKVDPTNIRHQRGSFGAAFSKHEIRFGNEQEKLDKWRTSLKATADLSGWDSATVSSESKLVEDIVNNVRERLRQRISACNYAEGLVGIEHNMQKIETSLHIAEKNKKTRIIGLWGMGGIGKTTLARALLNKFSSQFSGSCFVEIVSDEIKKSHQYRIDLQNRVFSELLKVKDLQRVTDFEMNVLRRRDVLLVLDNVNDATHLDYLAKDRDWFGPGSRVIVTTRDSQVLKNIPADEIHEIEELSSKDALRLFLSKAFNTGGESPAEEYSKLAIEIVEIYAKGNPLALTVLGRHLCSRSIEEWKSEMELLESTPHEKVQAILIASYNGLDQGKKDIFLDIACFFKGTRRKYVEKKLNYRYDGVAIRIRVLIDMALVTMNDSGDISMHDLIQEMGRAIVRQESNDPGERSRLWSASDFRDVLEDDCGTNKIQGIYLSDNEISDSLTTNPLVFKKMCNLWYLDIFYTDHQINVLFPEGLEYLPLKLRYLRWQHCPLKSLPHSFNPKNLRELAIEGYELEHIWNTNYKDLKNLKVLCLVGCYKLTQLPDLSSASKLERLDLNNCWGLKQLPDLSSTSNLKYLVLKFCIQLHQLPNLSCFPNLEVLTITECRNLNQIPDLSQYSKLEVLDLNYSLGLNQPDLSHTLNLKYLNLDFILSVNKFPFLPNPSSINYLSMSGTNIMEVPVSIESYTNIEMLYFDNCHGLTTVPTSICKLKCLKVLSMKNSSQLEHFPEILEPMKCLQELWLDGTGIKELHPSIERLTGLRRLSLEDCGNLEKLPDTIFKMWSLGKVTISGCQKLEYPLNLPLSIHGNAGRSTTDDRPQVLHVEQHIKKHHAASDCQSVESVSEPFLTFFEHYEFNSANVLAEFQRIVFGDNSLPLQHLMYTRDQWLQGTKFDQFREIDMCFSGSDTPNSFFHQTKGHCLDVILLPGWYNSDFVGFAMCALISFGDRDSRYIKLNLVASSQFFTGESPDISITKVHRGVSFHSINNGGDYVVMKSFHEDCSNVSDARIAQFNIYGAAMISSDLKDDVRIKKFGVRLIYRRDVWDFLTSNDAVLKPDMFAYIFPDEEDQAPVIITEMLSRRKMSKNDRNESLDLGFISSVNKYPFLPNPSLVHYLCMSGTEIKEVPVSIGSCTNVMVLYFDDCHFLKTLPTSICKLKRLMLLSMKNSSQLEYFPEILEPIEFLLELCLDGTGITELHPSIERLTRLKTLSLEDCKKLENLPETIYKMWSLNNMCISGCQRLKSPPKLIFSIKHGNTSRPPDNRPQFAYVKQHIQKYVVASDCQSAESTWKPVITFSERFELDFANVLAEFQRRVFGGNVLRISSQPSGLKFHRVREVDMCFPGDDIPNYFFHQNEGGFLDLWLLAGWYNPSFIGFAVTALISFGDQDSVYRRITFSALSQFTIEGSNPVTKIHRFSEFNSINNGGDYVLMQSFHADCIDVSSATQVRFNAGGFVINALGVKEDFQIKKFGVRLLYCKNAEQFHWLDAEVLTLDFQAFKFLNGKLESDEILRELDRRKAEMEIVKERIKNYVLLESGRSTPTTKWMETYMPEKMCSCESCQEQD